MIQDLRMKRQKQILFLKLHDENSVTRQASLLTKHQEKGIGQKEKYPAGRERIPERP